ncbi:Nn.00g002810.m01.CDS01 [Neocucurbitaria sp. VM-36]
MQVSNLLSEPQVSGVQRFPETVEELIAGRQYDSRQSASGYDMLPQREDSGMMDVYPSTETASAHDSLSPTKQVQPKHISFELLLPQSPAHKARLPMRVNIYPHDTTDSIITTVKNFYGLYERRGVIFEDRHGNTLIARFENFEHGMVVYVRVSPEDPDADEYSPAPRQLTASPRRPRPQLEEAFQMLPPSINHHAGSRAGSRTGRQSHSPVPGHGRRSASASKRIRPSMKSRGNSSHGSFADANGDVYSDSDGDHGSVTSSRRSRKEPLASADISVDNIVEGGRRKRAKFDSSELPLFVPPQVPMTASLSSVSPQRRISGNTAGSPYSVNQQTFSYSHPLPSPQSYGQGESSYMQGLVTPYSASSGPVQGYRARTRGSAQHAHYRYSGSGGVLPTPETTLGSISVISDEDVARQLMRLGDASNFSTHGRTSTSTLDDALSGKADAASSSGESDEGSEDERELPPLPYSMGRMNTIPRVYDEAESSGEDYEDNRDDSFKGESDEVMPDEHRDQRMQFGVVKARSSVSSKSSKPAKPRALSKSKIKVNGSSKPPMSPTSLPSQSRKASSASLNFQHQLGVDEEDLSSKPRCQRCRKSKKGCDRQRPCQRCKDAGIGAEGCVSEDEGNGRKGRYGRHMGVSVKKPSVATSMAPPPMHDYSMPIDAMHTAFNSSGMDKNKKRKR